MRRVLAALLTLMLAVGIACAEQQMQEVVHESERYVSVVTTTIIPGGNGDVEVISASTSALDGLYAGQALSLSQLLGLEQQAEGETVAAALAYALVWQQIEAQSEIYLENIKEADLRLAFQPETDFYLDMDGNVVFFIQQGEIAGEVAGILRFPFSLAELMSALAEP